MEKTVYAEKIKIVAECPACHKKVKVLNPDINYYDKTYRTYELYMGPHHGIDMQCGECGKKFEVSI